MWGHFFGKGFVSPVDDFGTHNLPSHPELLDKLAQQFKDSGYDTKALIRWIMNSDAYNLTSAATKDNEKDETLFSHMNLKPMTPEQLFDSLMVATQAKVAHSKDSRIELRRDVTHLRRQLKCLLAQVQHVPHSCFPMPGCCKERHTARIRMPTPSAAGPARDATP